MAVIERIRGENRRPEPGRRCIRRRAVLFPPLLFALALSGCASVARFNGLGFADDAVYVSGVTPVRQDSDHACGPACVAAVASHWGVGMGEVGALGRGLAADTTGQDLQQLAEKLGLQAFAYRGSMDDLRQNLSRGRPLIVMLPMPMLPRGGWLTGLVFSAWNEIGPRPDHWVVVVGLIHGKQVIVDDPASGPLLVRQDKFIEWWARKEHRSVLIAAPAGEPTRPN